ncbi:MAG: tRNA epoxyqueuosine(34) reductase QueG [Dysgonamonadaceae bacterium]|jgi:epoxyqueuosine reductase|nr:tRNA epoxyqueuosine(34) reductase QueG [Dysgonamonadaceae bacterium]
MCSASSLIKQKALELGFSACGICRPDFAEQYSGFLKDWLKKGFHGEMSYMERNSDKRSDPRLLVDDVKSIIITALNYYPSKKQDAQAAQVAYYAYGKDYHVVVKKKLKALYDFIALEIAPVKGRIFCDSAPFAEKYHAVKAGLGWVGKNTQLILPGKGSFFFLGSILLDMPLEYDEVVIPDRCGNCTKCIDACPTRALMAPGRLDSTRCLSYLSIEYKGDLPDFYKETIGNRVYGCDTCNTVCPWNQNVRGNETGEFQASEKLLNLSFEEIMKMNEDDFDKLFFETAIYRIGLKQLQRNAGV